RGDLFGALHHLTDGIEGFIHHSKARHGCEKQCYWKCKKEKNPKILETSPDLILAVRQPNQNWTSLQQVDAAGKDDRHPVGSAGGALRISSNSLPCKRGATQHCVSKLLIAVQDRSVRRHNLDIAILNQLGFHMI